MSNAYHCKTKDTSVKYHYIIDTIAVGEISVKKVHCLENPTKILTNPLDCHSKLYMQDSTEA